ncbi:MAG TPA: hypothetical protein PLW95_06085 [bacterium]|nr:hypothetical protein [bacterium]
MRKVICLVGFVLLFFGGLHREYILWGSEENIKEILTMEEWNRYQELTGIQSKKKEVSGKYWQAVGPSFDVANPKDKEPAQLYKEELEKYDKILKEKSREFFEILIPQKEKIFLLAVEIDIKDSESAGWILAKGFSDIESNPETFLKAYVCLNKYEDRMQRKEMRDSMRNGIFYLVDKSTFEQEENRIRFANNFLLSEGSIEDKKITAKFLWEVWSGFFPRIERMENKSEAYEKMNQQSLSIIETLNSIKTDIKLTEEVNKVLQNFHAHYSRKDLPVEFLQSSSISNVKEKIAQSMKKD